MACRRYDSGMPAGRSGRSAASTRRPALGPLNALLDFANRFEIIVPSSGRSTPEHLAPFGHVSEHAIENAAGSSSWLAAARACRPRRTAARTRRADRSPSGAAWWASAMRSCSCRRSCSRSRSCRRDTCDPGRAPATAAGSLFRALVPQSGRPWCRPGRRRLRCTCSERRSETAVPRECSPLPSPNGLRLTVIQPGRNHDVLADRLERLKTGRELEVGS